MSPTPFDQAKARYQDLGVNVEDVLAALKHIPVSIHCWQGDDVGGFEAPDAGLSGGGIAVTGNFPGKARSIPELRQDIEKVLSLVPGHHRLNLHAIYGDFGGRKVDRDEIEPAHFESWMDWARGQALKLDFNATCFSHPQASGGLTLSHPDSGVREFWKEHVKRCRAVAARMGEFQGSPCVHNLWIPDGVKDLTVNRLGYRALLKESLDDIFATAYPQEHLVDAVESKLFGIGAESYTVGSHEFYLNWAARNNTLVCLDMGHFHPTESVADKVSAMLLFFPGLLLHVSRPVRWDSDHVVLFDDPVREVMQEVVRSNGLGRTYIALDFFDASINRVGAWVLGLRATLKALLYALLEPIEKLRACEVSGNGFGRLALLEECKTLPFGAVWEEFCERRCAPNDSQAAAAVAAYGRDVLLVRR